MRPGRIELPSTPWQGVVIPLNYGRIASNNLNISRKTLVVTSKFPDRNFSRPRLAVFAICYAKTKTSLRPAQVPQIAKQFAIFGLVLPEGFEPPTTASKAGMISISLREHVNNTMLLHVVRLCHADLPQPNTTYDHTDNRAA